MSKIFKSLFFLIISIFGLFIFQIKTIFANSTKDISFIVTAYYSPLPNQKHYIRGSYYRDKKLNGAGHTTASGKSPFMGILAAPKKYPFGTKIYFEGYGVGVVEDRGGAIVKAGIKGHKYDRIDIWMGYGDEGLERALKWGKRILKGRVVSTKTSTSIMFSKNILNSIENIKVNPKIHKKEDVIKLQEKFKELGLYNGKIDGKYSSIKNYLINFQLKNNIIKSKNSIAAGWFGPKTYLTLLKKYGNKNILIKQENLKIIETNPKIEIILEAPNIKLNGDNPQKNEVIKVQKLFKKLGLYNGKIDGDYNKIKNKILEIQKKVGLIKNNDDWGAGYFGEKTKAGLIQYCENKYSYRQIPLNRKKISIKLNKYDKIKLNKIINKIGNFINKRAGIDNNKKRILKFKIQQKLINIRNRIKKEKIKLEISYIIKYI